RGVADDEPRRCAAKFAGAGSPWLGPPHRPKSLGVDTLGTERGKTFAGEPRTVMSLEIQLILAVAAVACALPGVYLVLRRMALFSAAISHSLLLGIVLAFLVTRSLTSPLLVIGAAAMGLITVLLVELLNRTRLVREDAAIGLVFPALFSIGVILI